MKILSPIDITLTSTNVPETDYSAWSAGTTYAIGDRVIIAVEHNIYESLVDSNIGNAPTTSTDKWVLVGKTNAYKCIDDKVSTQTINATSIVMEFPVGKSTSIAFLNVECSSLKVEIYEGTTQIFEQVINGITRDITGWYSYFFSDFSYKNFFLIEHLYNPTATYKITLTGEMCKLGVMIKGTLQEIGCTLWDASLGFVDYSKKTVDEWGETYLKEGSYRDYFRGEIVIDTPKLSLVRKLLRERRGKLSLFIPTETYDMTIYGYAQEPELIWQNLVNSVCTFDIQGVI